MDQQTPQISESYRGKGPLDAFLNLLSLISIGWLAFAFGGTLFQIINKFFTNRAFEYTSQFSTSALKFNLASLIIVTPVVIITVGLLHKNYKENKLNHQSGIYRWLTYLMLLAAFGNIIGSLIALVFKLLNGEYFPGPLLKIGVVFLIALAIFGYYFFDLKRKDYSRRLAASQAVAASIIILAVVSIIGGIAVAGSPQESRMRAFDDRRTGDLSALRSQIENYYYNNTKLPIDLSDPQFIRFVDPETSKPYEYNKTGDTAYQLCADFSLDTLKRTDMEYYPGIDAWFYHQPGHQCYDSKIIIKNSPEIPGQAVPTPVPVKNIKP